MLRRGEPPAETAETSAPVTVSVTLTAAGSVDDYTPTVQSAMRSKIAAAFSVSVDQVTLTITAGSVTILIAIQAASAAAAATVQNGLTSQVSTPAAASAFLTTSSLGVSVTSVGTVGTATTAPSPPPAAAPFFPPAEASSNIGMVIVAGGGGGAFLLVLGIIYCLCKKKTSGGVQIAPTPREPKTSVSFKPATPAGSISFSSESGKSLSLSREASASNQARMSKAQMLLKPSEVAAKRGIEPRAQTRGLAFLLALTLLPRPSGHFLAC